MTQFTANEVLRKLRERFTSRNSVPVPDIRLTRAEFDAFADLLEAQERAEPVAWSLIFEESIGVNAPTTYKRREDAEDYADACAIPDKCNPFPHRPKVVPLYIHPAPADVARLADQHDDAFQQAVQEARRVWMDEFPCEAGHDHVTPFDQFLYGNRPCVEAQPPAASVTDGLVDALRHQRQIDEDGAEVGVSRQAVDEAANILAMLAAQENRNG